MEGAEFSPMHHSNTASKVVGIGQGRVTHILPPSSEFPAFLCSNVSDTANV